MAAPIIDHNLLTLDYWQDSVTYEGKTVPGGTIGCEALNIPDTLREKLAQASIPLQKIVAAIKENNLTAELLCPAKGSVLHMIQLAKDNTAVFPCRRCLLQRACGAYLLGGRDSEYPCLCAGCRRGWAAGHLQRTVQAGRWHNEDHHPCGGAPCHHSQLQKRYDGVCRRAA